MAVASGLAPPSQPAAQLAGSGALSIRSPWRSISDANHRRLDSRAPGCLRSRKLPYRLVIRSTRATIAASNKLFTIDAPLVPTNRYSAALGYVPYSTAVLCIVACSVSEHPMAASPTRCVPVDEVIPNDAP